MHRLIRLLAITLALGIAMPLWALEIQDAKNAGWVGEQRDGYLGLVNAGAPVQAKELVAQVNQARRQSYQQLATKNKLDLATVEALAAEKALGKTQPGHYIQAADGSWVKK
jgi:uncharacterized protein